VHSYWDVVAAVAGIEESPIHDPEAADLGVGLAELVAGLAEDFPDVEAQLVLRHGLVDTVLTADNKPGDIVVVGRQGIDSPAKFLTSSIATAVLERARSTVVVVPQAGRSDRL
jgi:nucleotide-binding universal stress UspA family protein